MTHDSKLAELLEPLQTALELEKQGKEFFQEAAATTTSKLARQTFEFLAAEEDKHIERIEQFYRSLEETGEDGLPDTEPSDADARLKTFNDTLAVLKDHIKPSTTDVEAYRTAIAFENGAEEFYAKKVAESTNPKVQRFYQWLIDEEEMHSRLLNSCLEFVEDPAEWFRKRPDSED